MATADDKNSFWVRSRSVWFFSVLLAVIGILNFFKSSPQIFFDTARYWDITVGFEKTLDFQTHLGAFFPALLYAFFSSTTPLIFVNYLIWLITAFVALWDFNKLNQPLMYRVLGFVVIFLTWTSTLLLPWVQAILPDSIGLSLLALLTYFLVTGILHPEGRSNWALVSVASALLLLTKPAWLLILIPLIIWWIARQPVRKIMSIVALTVIALSSAPMTLVGQKQTYIEGLTYEGWWTLTRAAHLGVNESLRDAVEGDLSQCAKMVDLLEEVREKATWDGMPEGFFDAIASCPGVVNYLNSAPLPIYKIAFEHPVAFTKEAVKNMFWVNDSHSKYVPSPAATWFPMNLFAPLFGVGALFSITALFLISVFFFETRRKIFATLVLAITVFAMTFMVLTDGLEPTRHSLPFALFAILSLLFIVVSAPTGKVSWKLSRKLLTFGRDR